MVSFVTKNGKRLRKETKTHGLNKKLMESQSGNTMMTSTSFLATSSTYWNLMPLIKHINTTNAS